MAAILGLSKLVFRFSSSQSPCLVPLFFELLRYLYLALNSERVRVAPSSVCPIGETVDGLSIGMVAIDSI